MDNRDRDKLSRSTGPTDAGKVNRDVSERRGQEEHIAPREFGQNIGESENLEPNTRGDESQVDSKTNTIGRTGKSEGDH